MANYMAVVEKLESAIALLISAEEMLLPTDTMKLMDSYIIAHLRCCKVVNQEAIKAIKASKAYKTRKNREDSKDE